MFREETRTRERLASAMDALDRLDKPYNIFKKNTIKKCSLTGREYAEPLWIIEEVEPK